MKIEAPFENKIIVDLTTQDLAELDITYEDMDYANIETRRVIWTLLDRAGQALGRDIDPTGRMMIEAIPKQAGGCTMHFTIYQDEKPAYIAHSAAAQGAVTAGTLKKDAAVFTYEFHSADDLLDCAVNFVRSPLPHVRSALYGKDGVFRLLLEVSGNTRRAKAYFNEFASLCVEGVFAAAATREHWRVITPQAALEKIGLKKTKKNILCMPPGEE